MQEIVNEIHSQLKLYKEQPSYHANINSSACSFELLINDMPAQKFYKKGGAAVSVPINPLILKSGTQEFTIRLYSGYYKEGKELMQAESLIKETKFNLVIDINYWNDEDRDSEEVFKFQLPSVTDDNGFKEFTGVGKPYFEYKGTFTANVPYELNGWSKSVRLYKENKKKLEEEVINTYKNLISKFQNKEFESIVNYKKRALIERFQSIYHIEKLHIEESLNKYSRESKNQSYYVKTLENYKLHIYGNGKVICLERKDLINKGSSVVRIGYKTANNEKYVYSYGFKFHRPHKGAPLEPIR